MKRILAIQVYRSLTRLYPRSFRDEYRDDLVATFAAELSERRAAAVWWSTLVDLVVTVPSQHWEARMHRPDPRTVVVAASAVTVAALVLAVVAGTGPVVGVFLLAAVISLSIATLGWRSSRRRDRVGAESITRWRLLSGTGAALVAAVIVVINLPPYDDKELPGFGWAVMMLSLIAGVALLTVGLTIGIARRSTRHAPR